MKILFCLNQYMPQSMGGTEVYVHTLALFQKASGNEVAIITPHIEFYRPGQIREHYLYDGIDVYEYLETANPTDRQFLTGNKKPEGLLNFIELIKSMQPDIIHFHELNRSIGLGLEHVKLAKTACAKIILTIHLSSYTCNTGTLIRNNKLCSGKIQQFDCTLCTYKTKFNLLSLFSVSITMAALIFKRTKLISLLPIGKASTLMAMPVMIERIKRELLELAANTDRFVLLNQWYKNILLKNGVPAEKIVVIPQALATIKDSIVKKNSHPVLLPLKIIFIGRIQPQKGIHLMIEAIRNFTPDQVCIDIYGQAEDTPYYQKCINDSSGIKSLQWKGFIERNHVVECLTKYDLLCLPSTFSEMSPLVIQEAFAAGIPVLASNVYGNAEQINNDKNGWLFKFNDSKDLANKIRLLIDMPDLVLAARESIIPVKTFPDLAEKYQHLYKEVLLLL